MLKIDSKPVERKRAAPPPVWRNKWRCSSANGYVRDVVTGDRLFVGRGNIYIGGTRHPTKEIAEHKALKLIEEQRAIGKAMAIYLGPVPCDASGNPL